MNTLLALLICFSSARESGTATQCERVDRIELNHMVKCGDAKHVLLDQVIVWGWNAEYGRYDVRAYFVVSEGDSEPYPAGRGKWRYRYRMWGRWNTIETSDFIETTTISDPERASRRLLPWEHRVQLAGQKIWADE